MSRASTSLCQASRLAATAGLTTGIASMGKLLLWKPTAPLRPARCCSLEFGSQARALVDGALGVQLGGDVGAPDQMHLLAGGDQTVVQLAQRLLTGADDDGVHFQQLRLATGNADVQAGVIDLQVLDVVDHLHVLALQAGTVDPAGGLAEAVADLGLFALQQVDLTG